MAVCATGHALYLAWVSLVPQVATGEDNPVIIAAAVNTKTTESEAARLAYESHIHTCDQCHATRFPKYHPQPGDIDYHA